MNQTNKPWYIELPLYLIRFLFWAALWGILGFVIAFPLALIWLVIGRAFMEIVPQIASFIAVGFFAFAIGTIFGIGLSSDKSNTWQTTIRASFVLAFIVTTLSLFIFSIGSTSEKVLIEVSKLKISVGSAIGLGFGVIIGAYYVVRAKRQNDSLSPGCTFVFTVLILGYMGYGATEIITQLNPETLKSYDLLDNSIQMAIAGGFVWGCWKSIRKVHS